MWRWHQLWSNQVIQFLLHPARSWQSGQNDQNRFFEYLYEIGVNDPYTYLRCERTIHLAALVLK